MTDNKQKNKQIPEVTSPLREHIYKLPSVIRNASGIIIQGRRVKSLLYGLDVSVVENTDADAIFAVYGTTPSINIVRALKLVSKVPIFAGIGGGLTNGDYCANIAILTQEAGAIAGVLNGPVDIKTVKAVKSSSDMPIVYTVLDKCRPLAPYVEAGVQIFNVASGKYTVELVKWVREQYPDMPIIASGGPTEESILATIEAGANAITFTDPGFNKQYNGAKMIKYRNEDIKNVGSKLHV